MTSYERSITTMGLFRTVSEIDGDFRRKSQKFSTPLYFAPQVTEFLLELRIGAGGQKTRVTGLSGRERSLTISSAVSTECTNVRGRQRDGRADGRTDRHRATAKTALTHSVAWEKKKRKTFLHL